MALIAGLLLLVAGAAILWLPRPPPESLEDLSPEQRAEYEAHGRQAEEQMRLGAWEGAEADLQRCLSIFDRDIERRGRQDGTSRAPERTLFLMRGVDRSGKNDFRVRI